MLTIAFDTSTKNLSVALYSNEIFLVSKDFEGEGYVHSEKLLPFIKAILSESDKQLTDIQRVFISLGPGSYTGLRIGASAAKSLAFSLDVPVYGISSNEILYWSSLQEAKDKGFDKIGTMIDARRDEVYYQLFDRSGTSDREIESAIIDQEFIDKLGDQKVLFVGDGSIKFQGRFEMSHSMISKETIINKVNCLSELFKSDLEKYKLDIAYFDANYVKSYRPGKKKSLFN